MTSNDAPVVAEIENLSTHFEVRRGRRRLTAKAVDGVSLRLHEREIVALVGESGCGKTTIARSIMRLEDPTAGRIFVDGTDITRLRGKALRSLRRNFQMIFQDPFESLPANATALDVVTEGLRIHHHDLDARERRARALEAMAACGLNPPERTADRRMFQLSGGQRQRVAIAAALVLEPRLVVADEPVSMLDVSLRAGIIRALLALRDRADTATLFITHDLALAAVVADRVAVLYLGRVVEQGPAATVIAHPAHPYTKALVDVMPGTGAGAPREILSGEAPTPVDIAPGCRFAPRCPLRRALGEPARCTEEQPELRVSSGDAEGREHQTACHFDLDSIPQQNVQREDHR